jgi:Fe-S-cluster containining protein
MMDYPFSFNERACDTCKGYCCRWGGYVWITEDEMVAMADILKMDLEVFAREYVKAAYGRLSIQERLRDGEYQCAVFDPFNNRCRVYDARPKQCRTFPYWDQFKENYQVLLELCPGVLTDE